MIASQFLRKTTDFVAESLANREGSHDIEHVLRVRNLARIIAKSEGVTNLLTVELGALLHDIADPKFHNGDTEIGPTIAENWLVNHGISGDLLSNVVNIVRHISFIDKDSRPPWMSLELASVQDADRIDGLGAIGIARAFSFGGFMGCPLYETNRYEMSFNGEGDGRRFGPTINIFQDRLLHHLDMMNTRTGRKLAVRRHQIILEFLKNFEDEVELASEPNND